MHLWHQLPSKAYRYLRISLLTFNKSYSVPQNGSPPKSHTDPVQCWLRDVKQPPVIVYWNYLANIPSNYGLTKVAKYRSGLEYRFLGARPVSFPFCSSFSDTLRTLLLAFKFYFLVWSIFYLGILQS
jgi:hypothetical protein